MWLYLSFLLRPSIRATVNVMEPMADDRDEDLAATAATPP